MVCLLLTSIIVQCFSHKGSEVGHLIPPVTNYLVRVSQHRYQSGGVDSIPVSPNCLQHEDTSLWEGVVESNETYKVEVVANNSIGTSTIEATISEFVMSVSSSVLISFFV